MFGWWQVAPPTQPRGLRSTFEGPTHSRHRFTRVNELEQVNSSSGREPPAQRFAAFFLMLGALASPLDLRCHMRQFVSARGLVAPRQRRNMQPMTGQNMATLNNPARTFARTLWPAVFRGLRFRCPNCGRGNLFRSYLKPVDVCSECAENLGRIYAPTTVRRGSRY